jgi:nucleoside-diphosphate-sugar epimerase
MRALPPSDLEHILEKTRDVWPAAKGARFFVTGGTGFFGAWLLESFCHANRRLRLGAHAVVLTRDRVRFASRFPHLTDAPELSFVQGDAKSFVFPEGKFEFAVHAATETRPGYGLVPPGTLILDNIAGTAHFLDFVKQCGVEKFLFTSSGAIYGPQPASMERVSESDRIAPDPVNVSSAYGEAKRASELLCASATTAGRCEGKIARCFSFVGPHLPLDANYAIGNFIGNALGRHPLEIAGDGTPRRSYLYAADLAVWLWTILERGIPAQAYNVGSRKHHSIFEIAKAVQLEVAPETPIRVGRVAAQGALVNRYVPENEKARTELGLDEWIDLGEAIRQTASWHRGI